MAVVRRCGEGCPRPHSASPPAAQPVGTTLPTAQSDSVTLAPLAGGYYWPRAVIAAAAAAAAKVVRHGQP